MKPEELELIEKYLEGKLGEAEERAFATRVQQDAAFASEVESHRELLRDLRYYGERSALQDKLDEFHAEMQKNELPAGSGVRRFLRKHYYTMAVAAVVAAISVGVTILTLDYMRSVEQQQHAYYRELRRDLDKIRNSQNKIIHEINAENPDNKPHFGGTGFALSSNGYIVTSFHIVKGATTVLVGNSKFGEMRAAVVYSDKAHDLSILKVTDSSFHTFGVLPYSFKTTPVSLGEKVFTLGYPKEDIVYGEGSLSSSSGFEGDTASYQVSVPVNPGNSGSPLLDERGNVVGMISGKHIESEGASFALKSFYISSLVRSVPKDLLQPAIKLPVKNLLQRQPRTQQLKKLQEYVFVVRTY